MSTPASIKPVYAIVGDEPFLQMESLRAILAAMPADVQRVDLDGDTAQLADVMDELQSFSMFGGHKLLVIRDADDFLSKHREKLEAYCEKPSSSSSLVLRLSSLPKNQRIYKAIAKAGEVLACEPPKPAELAGWVSKRAGAHGVKIESEAARAIADLIGPDFGRLDSELARLALQSTSNMIRVADVTAGVAFQREQQMWEMTDALTLGRADEAVRRWRQIQTTDSSAEFRAVTWLAIWLEKAQGALALSNSRMNAFAIAKQLKIWPAQNVEKLIATASKLGEPGLKRATERLIEVDRRNKSSLGKPAENVERFLLSLA